MKCPKCNKEIKDASVYCENCGIYVQIYEKVINSSIYHYNMGLEKIKLNDLSGGIVSLEKSISFNKNNFRARNLLGLIFYELGRLKESYKQFSISSAIKDKENNVSEYLEKIRASQKEIDEMNEAIGMYNQAIIYSGQNSSDIAIIQLKKAIDINPKFLEALNLLTACYISQDDKQKAISCLEKILSVDINNESALKYKSILGISKINTPQVKEEKQRKATKTYVRTIDPGEKSIFNNFGLSSLLFMGIGAFVGFLLLYILIIPGMMSSNRDVINELRVENEKLTLEKEELSANNEKTIKDLEQVKLSLEEKTKNLQEKVVIQEKLQNLTNAGDLITSGSFEEAAEILFNTSTEGLSADDVARYEQLISRSYVRASTSLYNRGVSLYKSRSYVDSRIAINASLKFAEPNSAQAGDCYFYLGEISYALEDMTEAKINYEKVVNEYRNARNYWSAKNKLSRIE